MKRVIATNEIPDETTYVDGSAHGAGTEIDFSTDNGATFASPDAVMVERDGAQIVASAKDYTTIRWRFAPALEPGEKSYVSFNVRLN